MGRLPGIGKSTLCSGLAAGWPGRVDHFREEEILTRPEFVDVAAELELTGRIALDTLHDATARFVASSACFDAVIADALFPYIPLLLAMGHSDAEIDAFVDCLATVLAGMRTVMVFLDGEPVAGLRRAAAREEAQEPGWLDW